MKDDIFEKLEQFTEVKGRFGADPMVTISANTGRLSLNKSFWNAIKAKYSNNIKYLYILHAIDNGVHLIGLQFSEERKEGAVAISAYARSGASASIKSFLEKHKLISTKTKTYDIGTKSTQRFGDIYYFVIGETKK